MLRKFNGQTRSNDVCMANRKAISVAFALEDEARRSPVEGRSLSTRSPSERIDVSVEEAYTSDWTKRVRTQFRRSDRVIALVCGSPLSPSGQEWGGAWACEERRGVLAACAYAGDQASLECAGPAVWFWAPSRTSSMAASVLSPRSAEHSLSFGRPSVQGGRPWLEDSARPFWC